MNWSSLLVAVGGLVCSSSTALAVDYDKIDRTIKKEPAYQSGAPEYALLLFGPEAKVRVWLVFDGETLYLDRHADGDLTGKDKRFAKCDDCRDVEITDPDGRTCYRITAINHYKDGQPPQGHLMVSVDIKGPLAYQQYCDVALAVSPTKAKLAHFHGPLTIGPRTISWQLPPLLALHPGDQPADLFAMVGTMDAAHGCWVVVRTHHGDKSAFAEGIVPVVDIEFPPAAAGGAPVRKSYRLEKFC